MVTILTMKPIQKHTLKLGSIWGIVIVGTLGAFLVQPISQDPAYHNFADTETVLAVPHFWNVASNLPFILVGYLGLRAILGKKNLALSSTLFWAYLIFFAAIGVVGIGSAYYHFQPMNETLVWDRLPMTLGFMAFFSIIIGEYISTKMGAWLLWPLLAVGLFSVAYWHFTEIQGQGDLRLYGLVQFFPILLIPAILLMFKPSFTHVTAIWAVLGLYLLSKLAELWDGVLYGFIGFLSGHSLKHIIAALAPFIFLRALEKRKRIGGTGFN